MERLQKLIAQAGVASRRKAEEMIAQGRVKVNGTVVNRPGTKASFSDCIEVDGKQLQLEKKVYYLLNKPKHTLCTVSDDRGRKTILSCFPENSGRIYPIGRLDYETTGVLLVSNDGDFANSMMHPRYHLPKTYYCTLDRMLTEQEMQMLEKGIMLDDGMTLGAEVSAAAGRSDTLSITIFEGRNREVRRMMEYFGREVKALDRVRYGFLGYGSLKRGQYRSLSKKEVDRLIELSRCHNRTPASSSSAASGSI